MSDDDTDICGYADDDGRCTAAPDVHIRAVSPEYGHVCMLACAAHAGLARASSGFRAEHPAGVCCGITGSVWDDLRGCLPHGY